MARPLRHNVGDGWYHVFHRGTERCAIFLDDRDRERFLELLGEVHERYRVRIHAYVLMDTHYHGIWQTPEANLSQAMQWLHLSYAAWFNARHDRLGALWQGRFGAVPVQGAGWAYALSLYVHLNPVCTELFGLGKCAKKVEALGWSAPSREEATRRLKQLRTYPWSSYRCYGGYAKGPAWLETEDLLKRAAARPEKRQARYRRDLQARLTRGAEVSTLERLADRVGIGSQEFVAKLKAVAAGGGRETSGRKALRQRVAFADIVSAVERVRGEKWAELVERRGDWARPLAMWVARRYGGLSLREIGKAMDGRDYAAVGMALKRFESRFHRDAAAQAAWRGMAAMLYVET